MRRMGSAWVIGCVMAASAGALLAEDGTQKEDVKAFIQQQKEENKEFREELKDKNRAEKIEAIKDQIAKQHEENVAFLKEKLAKSKLTDVQQEEIVSFVEKQYGEKVVFRDARLSELMKEIETLSNDDSLTMEQKKAALKEHVAKKRAEAKAFHEQQKAERKAAAEKLKAEKANAGQ